MKELSIEQKAQRYDEALTKARNIVNSINVGLIGKDSFEAVFPELKESEDEKIRKNLIGYIKGISKNEVCEETKDSWIAWLEKQGETSPILSNSSNIGKDAWSEEEQNRFAKGVLTSCVMSFIDYLDAHKYEGKMCVSNGECEDIENAFHNAMWDRLHRYYCKYIEKQGKQSLVWSEEDEVKDNWELIREFVNKFGRIPKDEDELNVLVEYVLKRQKPVEWSEEDENRINRLIAYFEDKESFTAEDDIVYANWLKSLKPQNKWKPSDEQMLAINTAINVLGKGTLNGKQLIELREELQKLREDKL